MDIIGSFILIFLITAISAIITAKIIAVRYFEIIDDYLKNYDKQIMDLISWAKEKGR